MRWLLPRGQFWQYHTDMIHWNEWIGIVLHMRLHSVVATEDCTEHSWLLCIWMRNDPRKLSWSSLVKETHTMSAGVCHVPSLKTLWQILNHQILDLPWIFPFPPSVPFCAMWVRNSNWLAPGGVDCFLTRVLNTEMGMGRTGPNDQLCTMAGSVVQYKN